MKYVIFFMLLISTTQAQSDSLHDSPFVIGLKNVFHPIGYAHLKFGVAPTGENAINIDSIVPTNGAQQFKADAIVWGGGGESIGDDWDAYEAAIWWDRINPIVKTVNKWEIKSYVTFSVDKEGRLSIVPIDSTVLINGECGSNGPQQHTRKIHLKGLPWDTQGHSKSADFIMPNTPIWLKTVTPTLNEPSNKKADSVMRSMGNVIRYYPVQTIDNRDQEIADLKRRIAELEGILKKVH